MEGQNTTKRWGKKATKERDNNTTKIEMKWKLKSLKLNKRHQKHLSMIIWQNCQEIQSTKHKSLRINTANAEEPSSPGVCPLAGEWKIPIKESHHLLLKKSHTDSLKEIKINRIRCKLKQ